MGEHGRAGDGRIGPLAAAIAEAVNLPGVKSQMPPSDLSPEPAPFDDFHKIMGLYG
jgi:hypothetical protein